MGEADATERLTSFEAVASWAAVAGLLSKGDASVSGATQPHYELALDLRADFQNVLLSRTPAARRKLLKTLNLALSSKGAFIAALESRGEFRFGVQFREPNPSNVSFAIANAILECLRDTPLDSIKQCEAADCIWFFVDTTKNRSRRWCVGQGCGARSRSRKHYHLSKVR